jgi:K+-transporting ATPase KdpF subunit
MTWIQALGGALTGILLVYLFVAMLKPEWF